MRSADETSDGPRREARPDGRVRARVLRDPTRPGPQPREGVAPPVRPPVALDAARRRRARAGRGLVRLLQPRPGSSCRRHGPRRHGRAGRRSARRGRGRGLHRPVAFDDGLLRRRVRLATSSSTSTGTQSTASWPSAARVLRPGGRLILLQPNFRLNPGRYFDDFTHVSDLHRPVAERLPRLAGAGASRRGGPLPAADPEVPRVRRWRSSCPWYLRSPIKPLAGQMLIVATPRGSDLEHVAG